MHNFFDFVTDQLPSILLLVFGFGFVIFWHELGHFLAAKWADVRVEQFAVGFGQALFSWRKGIGWTTGSSGRKLEGLIHRERELAAARDSAAAVRPTHAPGEDSPDAPSSSRGLRDYGGDESDEQIRERLGIGETEYRLNWLPLGGYVKMLGQDDLNPNAVVNDPRAYNMKSIPRRMVIVSAGVVMNIILAVIGFSILFKIGFDVPPPVVGQVYSNSPAQKAGVQVGDRVLEFDGKTQHDFTKIQLNVALVRQGEAVPIVVRHVDGNTDTLQITAEKSSADLGGFLALGIEPAKELRGLDPDKRTLEGLQETRLDPQTLSVKPGDKIVAINGEPVQVGGKADEIWKLDRAMQQSDGKPVTITTQSPDGKTEQRQLEPRFVESFDRAPLHFAGLTPRAQIEVVNSDSSAKDKLQPGDVITAVTVRPINDTVYNPGVERLQTVLDKAGKQGQTIDMTVLRGGQQIEVKDLTPNVTLPDKSKGLGIGLKYDVEHPVVAALVERTPAATAKVPVGDAGGTRIVRINDQPVQNWHDVRRIMLQLKPGPMQLAYSVDSMPEKTATLTLAPEDVDRVRNTRYRADLLLHERSEPRQTNNPLTAIVWGIGETRDLIVQFYVTLQRMVVNHSVSYKNMMGPVGIFSAGTKFAYKGTDWLIWFLSMISANLAVVNFLPIPIVDGGLFTFLIIEKIQGRPISPRVQSIAQVVGLALILSIFILVTIQDITR